MSIETNSLTSTLENNPAKQSALSKANTNGMNNKSSDAKNLKASVSQPVLGKKIKTSISSGSARSSLDEKNSNFYNESEESNTQLPKIDITINNDLQE